MKITKSKEILFTESHEILLEAISQEINKFLNKVHDQTRYQNEALLMHKLHNDDRTNLSKWVENIVE